MESSLLGEMADWRLEVWKVQDEPETFVPENEKAHK